MRRMSQWIGRSLAKEGSEMGVRVLAILGLLVAIGLTAAAAQETKQTTPTTTTKHPSAQGVRQKLGPDFQFLLDTPPPSGGKVSPGDALILRSLCGTCTLNQDNPWSTVVVTRKDGTPVTLADLYQMHRDGAGWGKIAQQELGVKLGTLARESARGSGEETSGIVTGSGRSLGGSAAHHGHRGEKAGIVTGSGREVVGHGRGGIHGSSSSGRGRGK